MRCPPEIADVVLEILRIAILRIREAAWSGNAQRCAIEADHVHNLPPLLGNYSADLLKFYWDVERVSFLAQSSTADVADFRSLWDRLADHVGGREEHAVVGQS